MSQRADLEAVKAALERMRAEAASLQWKGGALETFIDEIQDTIELTIDYVETAIEEGGTE